MPQRASLLFRTATLALVAGVSLCMTTTALAQYPSGPQITDKNAPGQIAVTLKDWATVPASNSGNAQVARINFLRSEPVPSLATSRLFANDLNGNLYIVDRNTRSFTPYIDFGSQFARFDTSPGFAAGVVTFQFDPDYVNNGKFYTVHTETLPTGGTAFRLAKLYEWQDTNINDNVFTGTRAELLSVQYQGNIHPIGDILFNPTATDPSHPDWRNMYIASGDGGAGEQSGATRNANQMLNNLLGKILRITPTPSGTPGTYSIPDDNPVVAIQNARPEIYAYGLRNPHRMSWDVNPNNPAENYVFINDIGLHSFEEINILKPGANYGYSPIEGNMVLGTNNQVNNSPLPASLPVYVTNTTTPIGTIVPTYPVAQYSHHDGDAISSGFVYRGTLIPELQGKYVFGDITTGRLFYTDLQDLLAADDGDPSTMATIHELKIFYDSPYDGIDGEVERRLFDIIRDTYDRRNDGDLGDRLPGGADVTEGSDPYGVPYGGGRADFRLALIDNELYILSKSDGMIRAIVPEPAGMALLLAGAIPLLGRRSRRRH